MPPFSGPPEPLQAIYNTYPFSRCYIYIYIYQVLYIYIYNTYPFSMPALYFTARNPRPESLFHKSRPPASLFSFLFSLPTTDIMNPPPPFIAAASSLSEHAHQCALLGRHMELLLRRAAGSCREESMQLYEQLVAQQERLLADMRAALLAMEEAEGKQLGEWPHGPLRSAP